MPQSSTSLVPSQLSSWLVQINWFIGEGVLSHRAQGPSSSESPVCHLPRWKMGTPCALNKAAHWHQESFGQPACSVGGLLGFPRWRLVDSFLNRQYWHLCETMGVCRTGRSEQSASLRKYISFSISWLFLKRDIWAFSLKMSMYFPFWWHTINFSKDYKKPPFLLSRQ